MSEALLRIVSGFRVFWLDPATAKMIPAVRGGDGPDEGAAPEVPANFDGLNDDDLRDLHGKLQARYEAEKGEAKTRAQVETLKAYREAQARIVTELTGRAQEAADVATALETLAETPQLPDPEAPADPEDPEEPKPEEPEAPAEPAAPTPEAQLTQAIAAALAKALTPEGIAAERAPQTPAEKAPAVAKKPATAMTAAAGQSVIPFGEEVDLARIGEIVDNIKGRMGGEREEVKAKIASIPSYEEMHIPVLSTSNSTEQNDALIHEAVLAHQARRYARMGKTPTPAMTAAICDPLDIIREIPDYVSQDDPFASIFPSRPISRLGFQFSQAIALSAVSDGVQAGWDDADQASVDPDDSSTWKPVFDIVCESPCTVRADAASAGARFDVTTEMSSPERIRDVMSKLTAARIRARTLQMLGKVDALSLQWTRTGDYSLFPDTVYAVNDVLARTTYPERLNIEDYTLVLPWGFGLYLVTDIQGKEFLNSADFEAGKAEVIAELQRILGVDVVELRDNTGSNGGFAALPAVATPAALNDTPCVWDLRLLHTPSGLYGSTGLVDTGILSSPDLARMNKRQWFQEEFALLTKHGSPPWSKITLTSAASGSRAAASTKLACA